MQILLCRQLGHLFIVRSSVTAIAWLQWWGQQQRKFHAERLLQLHDTDAEVFAERSGN